MNVIFLLQKRAENGEIILEKRNTREAIGPICHDSRSEKSHSSEFLSQWPVSAAAE
jgi:hypothetical protein